MVFSNSQPSSRDHQSNISIHRHTASGGSISQPHSTHFGPQQGSKSHSSHSTPFQGATQASILPANQPPHSGGSSASASPAGSVAYIVLPNGQVQTVDMATIQQALGPNSARDASLSVPPTSRPLQHSNSAGSGSASGSGRMEPQRGPQTEGYGRNGYGNEYQQETADNGDLSFSLDNLSTKTLPLFSPPTPPPTHPQPSQHHSIHSQHSQPPSLHRTGSLPYSAHPTSGGGRAALERGQQPPLSHSAYSSPAAAQSMQQRAMHRGGPPQPSISPMPIMHISNPHIDATRGGGANGSQWWAGFNSKYLGTEFRWTGWRTLAA